MEAPFSAAASCRPSWVDYVRPNAIPGLSDCITRGLLRLDGVPIAATWIDVVAMRIVEWAVATRQTVVLLSPDPYDLLVPLTAAAVHVSRMTKLKKQSGGYPHSDAKVAVVTNRVRLRTAYRRLGVKDAKLFDAVPAARRLPTGNIAVLGREGTHQNWGTLFVDRASELRNVKGVTLVVVDLPVYDWDQLEAVDIPKIVIGHDPSDRLVHRLAQSTPTFAWDSEDLRGLAKVRVHEGRALEPVAARLDQLAAGTRCAPVPVPNQRVCENAALFWSDIGPLHRAARSSYLARELTNEAHELFQDLIHLSVPTSFFEQHTGQTLRARLRNVNHEEFQARGDLRDLYLPMVHVELRDLAAALGDNSPKTDALLNVLREQVDAGRETMLAARTATSARVHRAFLAQFPELKNVRVTSLGEVAEETPADVAVLTGLAPAWARHVYASGIAADVRVLAYVPEGPLTVAEPFIEAEHVRNTIAYQRKYSSWLARPALKARCWKALSTEDLKVADDETAVPNVDPSQVEFVALPEPPDVPPGLWDVGIPSLEQPEGERAPHSSSAIDHSISVDAVRVTFDDGRWALLDRAGSVTRFSRTFQRAEPGREVARLAVGDELVFLDGDARKDVLDKVLEVSKDIPHLATSATWVEYWRGALQRGKQKFGTYTALTDALYQRGCLRESQTVRLWVVGKTIGPSDPLDVKRLGEAIDDVPLRDHHATVYQGIDAFREAHAQLMQRVGALALHVGSAASAGAINADQIIDERSGLTAADFQGCVEILRIASISPAGNVPLAAVGRLHEARETEVSS